MVPTAKTYGGLRGEGGIMAKNKSFMYDMHTAHNLQKYEQYRYDMF